MKIWQILTIILLVISLPILSSCELLGIGGKSKEQKYYEQQLEIMRQQEEANQQAQQQYYEQLQQSLQDYLNQYSAYQDAQKQAEIQAIEQAAANQAKEEIPYN
jgi:hypothetical protein